MNIKMVGYILTKILGVEAILMILPIVTGLIYGESEAVYFLIPMAMLAIIFLLGLRKPKNDEIYGREGMVIVALAWIFWAVFGAIPFTASGCIPSYVDAFFEMTSGFTTTGSTILTDIESLPMCMLFWRSFSHWIGGMGVLMFVMLLTTLDKQKSMYIARAEMPGPEKDKLAPRMSDNARIMYGMYFALTAIEVVFLLFGGMSLFDALVHSFGTAGTGGFSSHSESIAYFNSAYIDGVITVFMILFGINFGLYFLLLHHEWKDVLKNEELRFYLLAICAATVVIVMFVRNDFDSVFEAFRYAVFQVGAIITTTGYGTYDFTLWPMTVQVILVGLMIMGACASSTGGGIKVSRVLLIGKSIHQGVNQMTHPKSVSIIRVNGKKVGNDVLDNLKVYVFAWVAILIGSVLIVSLDNMDFTTTFSAVLTTMSNTGPGLGAVGPSGNFAMFSPLSKLVMCFDMLVGRLEIFPFLMLFNIGLWRKEF